MLVLESQAPAGSRRAASAPSAAPHNIPIKKDAPRVAAAPAAAEPVGASLVNGPSPE